MPDIDSILSFLNRCKIRATYGAVGGVIGMHARSVSGLLGSRRPEASWVVRADSGLPTGYRREQIHPDIYRTGEIIRTGAELRRRMLAGCDDERAS